MSTFTAPKADTMIHRASSLPASSDGNTKRLLLQLIQMMQEIAVCGDDERRRLWITAEREPIEDYGSYEDYLADGEVETREEFNDRWLSEYPEPQKWYELITTVYKGVSYVFIDGKLLFQITPDEKIEYELDWSDLAEWLLSAVGNAGPAEPEVEKGKCQYTSYACYVTIPLLLLRWRRTELPKPRKKRWLPSKS